MQSKNALTRAIFRYEERTGAPLPPPFTPPKCDHCGSFFSTTRSLNSHISQRPLCKRFQKQREEVPAAPPLDLSNFELYDVSSLSTDLNSFQEPSDGRGLSFRTYGEDFADPGQPSSSTHSGVSTRPTGRSDRAAPGGASPQASRRVGTAAAAGNPQQEVRMDPDAEIVDEDVTAGHVYGRMESVRVDYEQMQQTAGSNPFAPFASRMDWEVARWAKKSKTGDNQLTGLLDIPGVRCAAAFVSSLLTALLLDCRQAWPFFQERTGAQPNS